MRRLKFSRGARLWGLILVAAIVAGTVALNRSAPAEAHCDSIDGPVVKAARQALETGDVALVLPYVQPDAEAELTAAFQRSQAVRWLGGEPQQLADRWFFETAVRLHRLGEGASYTGLKEHGDLSPALAAADEALETGDSGRIYAVLEEAVRTGVAQKYRAVQEAREEAAHAGTVAANRERVEAELIFEKYVDDLYRAAQGLTVSHEAGLLQPVARVPAATGATCP